ncbi:MAG: tetratricopeptide repeat protein [Candidatus Roseilinea sp.]|uniref:tetratricopeptide repeat protein n=1 Tax=Candidatus Roseilinea sp. TaxID=2838777 RepID=UPI00404A3127
MGKLQQQVTVLSSADELRLRIDHAEKILRFDTSDAARDLLATLHQAHRMADQLERDSPGIDLRPERARLSGLDDRALRNAKSLVKALGGMTAFEQFRRQFDAQPDDLWWQLDAKIALGRRRLLQRLVTTGVVLAALGVIVFLARDFLFPYNPVSEAVDNAAVKLDAGDLPSALVEIESGLVAAPDSMELLVWKGILLKLMGDEQGSEQAFEASRRYARNETEFYLMRGQTYIRIGRYDEVIADADAVLAIDPDSAEAYYLRATGYEGKGNVFQAMMDVDQSAQLAQDAGNDALYALARYRYAMMMQAIVRPTPLPTP